MDWISPVLVLVLGLGLTTLELIIPSGGILGFLAISSVLASIIMPFWQGHPEIGLTILVVAVVGLPTVIVTALKWWPKTAIGRRFLLMVPKSKDVLPEDPRTDYLKSLIGQVAQAKCKMLPAGALIIDGRTVDAISEGMPIEAGQRVRVIEVRANRVVVRPVEEEAPSPDAEDPLSRTYDDPFERPPG